MCIKRVNSLLLHAPFFTISKRHCFMVYIWSLLQLVYADANCVGDPINQCCRANCFLVGNSLVSWRNKKQIAIAPSSTKVEYYYSLANITSKLLWLHWLLKKYECLLLIHITLVYLNNMSAIQIVRNDIFYKLTKHIEIDCHFIRHILVQSSLQLHSITFHDQLVDIFYQIASFEKDFTILLPNSSWFLVLHLRNQLEFEGAGLYVILLGSI